MAESTNDPAREYVPDEPHTRPGPTECRACGSTDLVYDERVDETVIYCRDCGYEFP